MGLITDSDVIDTQDLLNLDSEVTSVAASMADDSPVTIEGQNGIIRQAWDECGDRLFEKMDSFGGSVNLLVGAGVQMATLLTNYGMGVSRSRIFLTQVIADDGYANRTSPLRRYLAYKALEMFYRDASERVINDRYEKKRARFEKDAALAWRRFAVKGLPVVLQPLPCPGALHERNSGTWSTSNITTVASPGAAGGAWDVAITWVDGSKYVSPTNKGNAESGPSATASPSTTPINTALQVNIVGLTPPNGSPYQSGTFADGILALLSATGWNVYAGVSGSGLLYLQNPAPIPVGTIAWSLPSDPVLSGPTLQPGQTPDANYAFANVLQRG